MSDSNNKSASMQMWTDAIGRMLERIEDTRKRVGNEYPHWANPETGTWTTTVDGDWTGGFWAGMHWLAAKHTGNDHYHAQAAALAQGLKNRVGVDTVFKSFRCTTARRWALSFTKTKAPRIWRSQARVA